MHRVQIERANVRRSRRDTAEDFLHIAPTISVEPLAGSTSGGRLDVLSTADLLALPDDDTFVSGAYWAVLRRAPDPSGQETYRDVLLAGTHSRLDVIGILRSSPEGRSLWDPAGASAP